MTSLFAGKRPNLRFSAWLFLALGAIGAVAATVSGLVVHLAYDNDPVLASAIEVHQYTAFAATAVFAALAALALFAARAARTSGVPGRTSF